jgi:mutator protein MutT
VIRFTSTALLVRDYRVLLGKRTSTVRFAGMWDAFGGHREKGETPAHTLVRELYEELGIRVTVARFFQEYEDKDPTSQEIFHHHLYLVTGWQGEPHIANDEHSEIRWYLPEEAAKLKLQPHLKEAIGEVLAKNV